MGALYPENLYPDELSDAERAQALLELPNAGLALTRNQYMTLAFVDPQTPEVVQWLAHNGLRAEAGQTVELTVDGDALTMKLSPNDFGTEYEAD